MSHPNIIFCHVDQMHWNAMSGLGNPNVHTPHLDRMHTRGTSFAYHWAANPICCPARTSWYTGTPSYTNDTIRNGITMRPDLPDLGQWMSARDYDCYYVGKWHVGGRKVAKSFKLLDRGSPRGEELDTSVTRSALSFLDQYKEEQPFFLNLGYLNPHDCCYLDNMKEGYATKLGLEDKVSLPPLPETATAPPSGQYAATWNEAQRQLYIWYYYRMMEMVDAEIGTVFQALEQSRHADNTIFIFTADHGEQLMEHNTTKKGHLWEGSCRAPLLVIGPGVRQGVRDETQISGGTDITATILDYAGIEPMPEMTDTISLRPALEGPAERLKEFVVCETYSRQFCTRRVYFDDLKVMLDRTRKTVNGVFNMVKDADETNDLRWTPAGKEAASKAEAYLTQWAKQHKPAPRVLKKPAAFLEPASLA